MASIGISDVVTVSVSSEKTSMKKLMMMKMIIIITEKPLTMKKGDVGMAKQFSKKYENKGLAFDYPASAI